MYKIALVTTPITGMVTQDELKRFYEENKNEYKNDKGEILTFEEAKASVKKDLLAKKSKKAAILAYKHLKDGDKNFKLITVTLKNDIIPLEKMQTLISNGFLKPFVKNDRYISAKLVEEIKPKPLSFEEAKSMVLKDYTNVKTVEKLVTTAKESLGNFKGSKTGFVTKYDANKIKNLSPIEATQFLFTEFSLNKKENFILVPLQNPQKAVLYRVLEQKLLDKNKYEQNKKQIEIKAQLTLNAVLLDDLLKDLMAKYNIVSYVK